MVAIALELLCATASVFALAVPALAQEEHIAFLEESPLLFPPEPAESDLSKRVVVVAGGGLGVARVDLLVTGEIATHLTVEPESAEALGGRATFTVTLKAGAEAVTGFLVAITSGGAIARRQVEVQQVALPSEVEPPSSLPMAGLRWIPFSGLTTVNSLDVRELGISSDRKLPQELGIIQAPTGDFAKVVFEGGYIRIRGVEKTGAYSGSIHLSSTDLEHDTEVSLKVRDAIIWPALMLLVGLAIARGLSSFTELARPLGRLRVRLRRLQQRVRDARDEQLAITRRALGPSAPSDLGLPRISENQDSSLLIDAAARQGVAEWVGSLDQEERDAWKMGGERFKVLAGYQESYATAISGIAASAATYSQVINLATQLGQTEPLKHSQVLARYQELVRDRRIESKVTLDEVTSAVEGTKNLPRIRQGLEQLSSVVEKANESQRQELTGTNACPGGSCECGCWCVSVGTDTCASRIREWCDCCGNCGPCQCVNGNPSCCHHKEYPEGCNPAGTTHIKCRYSKCVSNNMCERYASG